MPPASEWVAVFSASCVRARSGLFTVQWVLARALAVRDIHSARGLFCRGLFISLRDGGARALRRVPNPPDSESARNTRTRGRQ